MAQNKPHRFVIPIFNWFYCSHCGLIALKNEATRKNKHCRGEED